MMPKRIDFYLDFMSPYAYLAHHRLLKIQSDYKIQLCYKVVDLPRLKIAVGNNGPANRAIPAKIAYLTQDLRRWAMSYEVPLMTPASHDSRLANIGLLVAIERDQATAYASAIWARTWGDGGDFASLPLLREVAVALDWHPDDFIDMIHSDTMNSYYENSTNNAVSAGVFGVPIMIMNGEMWWGNDRLNWLEDKIR